MIVQDPVQDRSQPTYEELKPVIFVNQIIAHNKFPAYLWGIETKIPFPFSVSENSSQPTYEELKHIPVSAYKICACVPSLPMRNWNPR